MIIILSDRIVLLKVQYIQIQYEKFDLCQISHSNHVSEKGVVFSIPPFERAIINRYLKSHDENLRRPPSNTVLRSVCFFLGPPILEISKKREIRARDISTSCYIRRSYITRRWRPPTNAKIKMQMKNKHVLEKIMLVAWDALRP